MRWEETNITNRESPQLRVDLLLDRATEEEYQAFCAVLNQISDRALREAIFDAAQHLAMLRGEVAFKLGWDTAKDPADFIFGPPLRSIESGTITDDLAAADTEGK